MDDDRSWWGWGTTSAAMTPEQVARLGEAVASTLGLDSPTPAEPARLAELDLPAPRRAAPSVLADRFSTDRADRARHTYGRSFRDVVRAFHGRLDGPPDLVARPVDEADVVAILDWAADTDTVVVPYGGGSSVVGGVEGGRCGVPWISLDVTRLDRVLEIDHTSRAARIQAGVLGPSLEDQLRPHDLTLRHFPQSFEFSTLGGWLATRSGGHYATGRTHIDDFVESIRTVTPAGVMESARLPGSGAGPSPDRLMLGSEGTLGVITEAWMRVVERPRFKASASVRFGDWDAAVASTRAVAQSGLQPANCRLLDATEALLSAGVADGSHLLILGHESAHVPVEGQAAQSLAIALEHGGTCPDGVVPSVPDASRGAGRDGDAGTWRNSFIRAPYTRDGLVALGAVVETFETAITWDRLDALHAEVMSRATAAVTEVCGSGVVTCRFTHVYPDGAAPYFSIYGPGRPGSQIAQWDEIKAAVSEVLVRHGATITHHHAVGRDHRRWYDQQRPDLFAAAVRAAKSSLDPSGLLNPGVLIDPHRSERP